MSTLVENAIGVIGRASKLIDDIWSVRDQTTVTHRETISVHCGQLIVSGELDNQAAINRRGRVEQ
jgi:hypothetical protein